MEDNNQDLPVNIEQTGSNQGFSLALSAQELKSLTGWATFRAVMDIIVGALSCLGIITAAYGVPLIIAGVKLLNATDELKRYMITGDSQKISDTLHNFSQYFKLGGISTIIKIGFSIIFIVLYIIFIVYIITHSGNIFQDIPKMQYYQ